jgi:hypothetical protein
MQTQGHDYTSNEDVRVGVIQHRPTESGVRKLDEAFPHLTEGQVIPWADIEAALHEPRDSARFNTIVSVWRKRLLEEQNIHLASQHRVGLVVAEPRRRILDASRYTNKARNALSKSLTIASGTDTNRLSECDQVRQKAIMHQARTGLFRLFEGAKKELPEG